MVNEIVVVTGGAGGMGLATAKVVGRNHHIVICDVHQQRLDQAVAELTQLGIRCGSTLCDITDPISVKALIRQAVDLGRLTAVIHTAGLSPQMADPKTILKVNALGTVNVAAACYEVASDGFALVNVASMAAYMFPAVLLPTRAYPLAATRPDVFLRKTLRRCRLLPGDFTRRGLAYGISKHFVTWFSKHSAARFGEKRARILSISPGSFDTQMGRLEEKSGSAEVLKTAALKRFGRAEEIAELLAFCASDKAGYLTGTDILCDGGVVAGRM